MRQIGIEEAFDIIVDCYNTNGWKPDDKSTREQRNQWLASGLACVVYGHQRYNPAGADPRWYLKSAGGGRPQSDDVIVLMPLRTYWDIIGSSGGAGWQFSISGHPEPLPAEQQVFLPKESDLPSGGPVDPPDPGEPDEPDPDPHPPSDDHAAQFLVINRKLDTILVALEDAKEQQAADTQVIGKWIVEQTQAAINAIVGVDPDGQVGAPLGPRIDAIKCNFHFGREAPDVPTAPTEG